MAYVDHIKHSIRREIEHLESRISTNIDYGTESKLELWEVELRILRRLSISLNKITEDVLSEDSEC